MSIRNRLFEEERAGKGGPVECLGMSFESDAARRKHFLERLRERLKDPEFRKIEGFPKGTDEDILALSDPPFYTACPNPFVGEFMEFYGSEYDAEGDDYRREPFAADVSEGKNDPIYNAHSYHTKVPHKAIMRYILHYTEPGDIVFDGFCGTGMTGVAAQLCGDRKAVEALGYRTKEDGTILDEEGQAISRLGARRAVLNDLSPAATFIAYNYNTPVDVEEFEREANRILEEVEAECGWMYLTLHQPDEDRMRKALTAMREDPSGLAGRPDLSLGRINYTVWSDVFVCPECSGEVVFWEAAVDQEAGKVRDEFACPHCSALLKKKGPGRAWETRYDEALGETVRQARQVPVMIDYSVGKKRFEKIPDDFDRAVTSAVEESPIPYWVPTDALPSGFNTRQPKESHGLTHVHHFYTRRNLAVLSAFRDHIDQDITAEPLRRFSFAFTAMQRSISRLASIAFSYYFHGGGGAINAGTKGTLYVSSTVPEVNVFKSLRSRLKTIGFDVPTSIVSGLDREYLDRLYTAYQQHAPEGLLGRSMTSDYVLLHVFGVAPETVTSQEDLIGLLLKRHYEGWMVPEAVDERLLVRLSGGGRFEDWPLREILPRKEAFLTFLQERWPVFLRQAAKRKGLSWKEPTAVYETKYPGPKELPFDGAPMRVYVDNMFLEGMLKPISSPVDEPETARLTDGWLSFGIATSPEQETLRRLEGLLDNAREAIPAPLASHNEWLAFARKWAELTALRYAKDSGESLHADEAFAELRDNVDESFLAWVEERYSGLHNLSSTAMVHHIPRFMARKMDDGEVGKVALVVVDGLSLGQWVPLRDALTRRDSALRFEERSIFAWAPTITPVSRQAIFAVSPPAYFPTSIATTSKEKTLWSRFWVDSVGLDPREVSYANFSGDSNANEIEEQTSSKTKVCGVVVRKVDKIMHGMELGEHGMHGQVRQWAEEGYLAGLIEHLVERGFEVYLTSDHGNVEARGIGNPGEGAVADIRGERVRVYDDPERRSRVAGEFSGSVEWPGPGLPKDYLPLLAPGRTAFVTGNRRIVGHGGISLEELAVPFVHVERRASGGDV